MSAPSTRIPPRAAQAFTIDEAGTDSDLVPKVWSTRSATPSEFTAVADPAWQIVISTHGATRSAVVQGPNDRAAVTPTPPDTEFFGIVFARGTNLAGIALARLLGRAQSLPVEGRAMWLAGQWWELPTPDNADVFAERLERDGALVHDRAVARALTGEMRGGSLRTVQRRTLRATGMTMSRIAQIARAHEAVMLLGEGTDPSTVAARLGYADQPHLTRSLRRFVGQTPGQLRGTGPHWSASSPVD